MALCQGLAPRETRNQLSVLRWGFFRCYEIIFPKDAEKRCITGAAPSRRGRMRSFGRHYKSGRFFYLKSIQLPRFFVPQTLGRAAGPPPPPPAQRHDERERSPPGEESCTIQSG